MSIFSFLTHTHTHICKVKLAIVVESNTKAPFSKATTPSVGESGTYFPGLFHFTLDPCLKMLSVKQGSINYHF